MEEKKNVTEGNEKSEKVQETLRTLRNAKEKKMKTGAVPAAKIPEILVPDAKGVAINPFGVNVQLTVNRPAKKSEA